MKSQVWIFSVRYRSEDGRTLLRQAVVGPACASTVETALHLAAVPEDVGAEIRAAETVRKFVDGVLDPDEGYYAPSPFAASSQWLVCIGSVQVVLP